MPESFLERCSVFLQSRVAAGRVFRFSTPMMRCLCALQVAAEGAALPEEQFKAGKRHYKDTFSAFSVMRGIAMPNMATLTALREPASAVFLADLNRAFFEIKAAGFKATDYQPLTAWLLATGVPKDDWETVAGKARRLYLGMRERHPFLTSGEDACFALLLATETDDEGEMLNSCEDAFGLLRERFGATNATQTIAHILALEPKAMVERCAATAELFDRLRELPCRFRRGMETTVLAALTFLYRDMDKAAGDVALAYHRLRAHRGFSMLSVGRNQCALYAAGLLAMEKTEELPAEARGRMMRLIRLILSVTVTLAAIQAAAAAAGA